MRAGSARGRITAALGILMLIVAFAPGAVGAAAPAPSTEQAQAAAGRVHYQTTVTPGYSVYCRWVPTLLIANSNGSGCFDSSGDYFAVVDEKANGKSVAVLWRGGGKRGICRNDLGAKKRSAWPTCKFSETIPEGIKIRAHIAECNKSANRNCRKFKHYTNPGPVRVYKTTHPAD